MEPGHNPLKNSLVLSLIYDKLEVKDQKHFRVVSKTWNDTSVQKYRRSVLVPIDMDEKASEWSQSGIQPFLDLWKGSSSSSSPEEEQTHPIKNIPFRNFKLRWSGGGRKLIKLQKCPMVKQFMDLTSPKMECLRLKDLRSVDGFLPTMKWILLEGGRSELKELALSCCRFPKIKVKSNGDAAAASKKKPEVKEIAENLRSLTITITQIEASEILGFFQIAPNLKELSTYSDSITSIKAMEALATSTKTMENPIKLETLETSVITANLLEYVKAARPKFKRVKLNSAISSRPEHFLQFLQYCSPTITKLEVNLPFLNGAEWIKHFNGLTFPQLKEFHLTVHESEDSHLSENFVKFDFNCLSGMNALKTFRLNSKFPPKLPGWFPNNKLPEYELLSDGDEGMITSSQWDMDNLEEFNFRMIRNFNVESLKKVSSWTKNLKRLGLVLDKKTFPVAINAWDNLEEFTLRKGSTVPEGLIKKQRRNGTVRIILE